jgi:hypothetical protein
MRRGPLNNGTPRRPGEGTADPESPALGGCNLVPDRRADQSEPIHVCRPPDCDLGLTRVIQIELGDPGRVRAS